MKTCTKHDTIAWPASKEWTRTTSIVCRSKDKKATIQNGDSLAWCGGRLAAWHSNVSLPLLPLLIIPSWKDTCRCKPFNQPMLQQWINHIFRGESDLNVPCFTPYPSQFHVSAKKATKAGTKTPVSNPSIHSPIFSLRVTIIIIDRSYCCMMGIVHSIPYHAVPWFILWHSIMMNWCTK